MMYNKVRYGKIRSRVAYYYISELGSIARRTYTFGSRKSNYDIGAMFLDIVANAGSVACIHYMHGHVKNSLLRRIKDKHSNLAFSLHRYNMIYVWTRGDSRAIDTIRFINSNDVNEVLYD